MIRKTLHSLLAGSLATLAIAGQANADNTLYAPGDLVLFFLENGGSNTIYVNLGPATNYRGSNTGVAGASNSLNIIDISSQLGSSFTNWATSETVFAGLAGVFNSSTSTSVQTNGDPGRTLYISKPRTALGTLGVANSTIQVFGDSAMTSAATNIINQNNVFDTTYQGLVAVSPKTTSRIDENNLFQGAGAGASFGQVTGGVHQRGKATSFGTFGPVNNVEFMLDLYRVQAMSTVSGQVGFGDTAIDRAGTYEGTIVIDSLGKVSFIVNSGLNPYEQWADQKGLVGADRDGAADPDKDGIKNSVEFVIGGEPKSPTNGDLLPKVERNGGDLVLSYRRTDASAYLLPFVEFDADLSGTWTKAENGSGGVVTITRNNNIDATTDRVTVTIPSAGAANFARLAVPNGN